MTSVYIGLGSNLNTPISQLQTALGTLARHPELQLVGISSLYLSEPVGPAPQPRYANAVAELQTDLDARELLQRLQQIETHQGRIRQGERWGPRTLDLDILLYGQLQVQTPDLQIPHYQMHLRPFVLYPLAEIAGPDLQLPDGRSLQALLDECPPEGLERQGPLQPD